MVDVPVPSNARSLWGSTYSGKINSWFNQNRGRTDLWPGKTSNARGFNSLKAILGELYGLDIRYYVKVDFSGFKKVVDTIGGVQINVQMPVYESLYPAKGGLTRVYIPAGPQHMSGTEALIYARSRHRAKGGDFDRGRRQQRVLLSLREQMNAQAIVSNLPGLVQALKDSVKTDVPTGQLPKLLALAESVDTRDIRSYVFSPPYYATEYLNSPRGYIITPNMSRIRSAVRDAFTSARTCSPSASASGPRPRPCGSTTRPAGPGSRRAPRTTSATTASRRPHPTSGSRRRHPETVITVYNGAEAELPETIAYLEKLYKTTVKTATDPSVNVDIIVTLGQDAPDLQVDAVG